MIPRYRNVSAGWARLLRSAGVQRATDGGAQKIVDHAKDLAPTHGPGITGRYHDSLRVIPTPGPVAESHAVADVPYAAAIEAKYNTLGRAMTP